MKASFWTNAVVAYLVTMSVAGCTKNADSLPYKNEVYTAKYEQIQGKSKSETIVSSNGSGRLYISPKSSEFIHDYNNGKNYMVYEQDHATLWTPLRDTNGWIYNGEWFKSMKDSKTLGAKKIEAYDTHGYSRPVEGTPTTIEVWFDDKTGAMVLGECRDDKDTVWTTKLTELKKEAVNENHFRLKGNHRISQFEQKEETPEVEEGEPESVRNETPPATKP